MMIGSYPTKYLTACKASQGLWMGLPPFILLLGSIGNLLSFLVLRQPSMSQISSYVYLATLAVVDEIVLVSCLLYSWLIHLLGASLRTNFLCKSLHTVGTASAWLSVWLIIALTVERVIVITFPLHANRLASPTRAKVIICTLAVSFVVINLHFIETVGIVNYDANSTANTCNFKLRYVGFGKVWSIIDATLYSYIPLLLISIMNAAILVQVYKARKSRRMLFHAQHCSMRNAAPCVKIVNNSYPSGGFTNSHQSHANASARSENGRQLTIMLVVISFFFLITTSPIVIFKTLIQFLDHSSLERKANLELVNTVTLHLMYLNHSMNFFLYCATGNKFRQQLKRLVSRNRRMHETVANQSAQSNSNYQARLQARRSTRTSNLNSCDEAVELRTLLPGHLAPVRQNWDTQINKYYLGGSLKLQHAK